MGQRTACASRSRSTTPARWRAPARSTRSRPRPRACSTQLKAAAANNGDVYVSIIPFSKNVNVGTSTYYQCQLDRLGRLGGRQRPRPVDDDLHVAEERQERQVEEEVLDHDHLDPGQSQHLERLHHRPRQELRRDRRPRRVVGTAATLFPAEQYDNCPVADEGLSYDWTEHEHAREHDDSRTARPTRPSAWSGPGCR